jgi:glycosyltransferase involved in cell wall biosynthesis
MIYNGLYLELYKYDNFLRLKLRNNLNISESTFVWVSVGRLTTVKNQNLLIRSFQNHLYSGFQSRLLIIGEGELELELKELAIKLNIDKQITFLGFLSNVHEFLNIADSFVLSSNFEGMPLALQEAISIGLPIIATDVGGCKELISNNGFLISKGDRLSLTDSMNKMASYDKNFLQKMKENSISISKKFDINSINILWLELYQKIQNL